MSHSLTISGGIGLTSLADDGNDEESNLPLDGGIFNLDASFLQAMEDDWKRCENAGSPMGLTSLADDGNDEESNLPLDGGIFNLDASFLQAMEDEWKRCEKVGSPTGDDGPSNPPFDYSVMGLIFSDDSDSDDIPPCDMSCQCLPDVFFDICNSCLEGLNENGSPLDYKSIGRVDNDTDMTLDGLTDDDYSDEISSLDTSRQCSPELLSPFDHNIVEPVFNVDKSDHGIPNGQLTHEEQEAALSTPNAPAVPSRMSNAAVIHTTLGDIHIRLFPQQAPKAVENFVGHAKSGYFEGVIFHRVIPKFMIQTGDPLGDGTGGTSIWGREFEDEFADDLKHDQPYTVSMANAGPGTNGSQFFITTTATPWLDKKHTIFGRALSGLEVIHGIENVKTNKLNKPFEDIKIVNIDVE